MRDVSVAHVFVCGSDVNSQVCVWGVCVPVVDWESNVAHAVHAVGWWRER